MPHLQRDLVTSRMLGLVLLAFLSYLSGCGCLRGVWLSIPQAVSPGDTVTLVCQYDLEGEPLYTVKWYKGRQEFFRFVPKEHPHTRVFPLPGINVDVSASGPEKVVLRDVQTELSGKYRCEVSADAPNFHTEIVAAHMHVIEMLRGEPVIKTEKARYAVGDTLRANCTSPPSSPPANLTWLVNGYKVNSSYVSRSAVESVTRAGLELEVASSPQGKVRLECVADLYRLYSTRTELLLDEERPRLASVLGGGVWVSGGWLSLWVSGLWMVR